MQQLNPSRNDLITGSTTLSKRSFCVPSKQKLNLLLNMSSISIQFGYNLITLFKTGFRRIATVMLSYLEVLRGG